MAAATLDEVLEQEVALRAPVQGEHDGSVDEVRVEEPAKASEAPEDAPTREEPPRVRIPSDVYVRSERDGVWRQRRPEPEPAPEVPREPLTGAFDAIDELLRARDSLRARIMAGEDLEVIAKAMMVCVLVCAGAVGASVGLFRGGVQVVYAAVKVPLVLLLATAAVAPVYSSMKAALRHEVSLREDFAMVLCSLALSCLVAAALSPLLLLSILNGIDYHTLIMSFVGLFALGGVAGYVFFFKALNAQVVRGHRLIAVTLLTTLAMVGCQLGWVMRPYVVRPKTDDVPFMRAIEGSFLDSVARSFDSARGIYDYDVRSSLGSTKFDARDAVYEEPGRGAGWDEVQAEVEGAVEGASEATSPGRLVEVAP